VLLQQVAANVIAEKIRMTYSHTAGDFWRRDRPILWKNDIKMQG
jgi:hypothetical protein